jgi:hypothetical protein
LSSGPDRRWRGWAANATCLIVGFALGTSVRSTGCVQIEGKANFVELSSLVVSIIALVWVPLLFERMSRKGAFDRNALSAHLAPAREALLAIDDAVFDLQGGAAIDLAHLTGLLRKLRQNLHRTRQIAGRLGWSATFGEQLDSANGTATLLFQYVTRHPPLDKAAEVHDLVRKLDDVLLDLLRASA